MKEATGPRSRYGKCLIKGLARNWGKHSVSDVMAELSRLYEDFQAGGFEDQKVNILYRETVEGVFDYMQTMVSVDSINKYRVYVRGLIEGTPNPTFTYGTDWSWMNDDVSKGLKALDESPPKTEASPLGLELAAFVSVVEKKWDYSHPFFLFRSKVLPSALLVVTSVGPDSRTNLTTNVNAGIGAVILPHMDEEHLVFESGSPVTVGLDSGHGRTYWGWVFKIISGVKVRFWMSKIIERETWDQRAKLMIRLDPTSPKGFVKISLDHKDLKVGV